MKSISRKNLKWNSLELQKYDICTYSCYWRIFNYLNRNAAEVICPFLAVYFILARSSFLLSLWTLLPDSLGRHVVVEKIGTKLNYLRPSHYGKVFCLFSNFFHLIFLLLFTFFSSSWQCYVAWQSNYRTNFCWTFRTWILTGIWTLVIF